MCSFQSSKAAFELAVNGFRKSFSVKPVCLAVTENRISGKWFQFDRNFTPLTRKWFYTFILPSNHFRVTRKRERESERKRKKEELAEIVCRNRPPSRNRDQRFVQSRSRSCEAPRQSRSRLPADRDRAKCLDLMIFFWVLFVFLYWEMNDIIYSFGNRENMRKCEQQVENVFSIVFSRTQPNTRKYLSKYFLKFNQTHENIFLFEK